MRTNEPAPVASLLEPVEIPPAEPVTPEEIERRRTLFAKVMARRESIDPIGLSAGELIHQVRYDFDGDE